MYLQRRRLVKILLINILILFLLINTLAEKRSGKAFVKKFELRLTFCVLFLEYILTFLIMVRALERWKWPGPLWISERYWVWSLSKVKLSR
jgi:hypothetical protein